MTTGLTAFDKLIDSDIERVVIGARSIDSAFGGDGVTSECFIDEFCAATWEILDSVQSSSFGVMSDELVRRGFDRIQAEEHLRLCEKLAGEYGSTHGNMNGPDFQSAVRRVKSLAENRKTVGSLQNVVKRIVGGENVPQRDVCDLLLEVARQAPVAERANALQRLADALAGADVMTVAHFTTQVKAAGLATKSDFMQAIREAAKSPTTDKRGPTHDELRDRWLAQHSNTAYGLGDWRRYDTGIWNVVSDSTIAGEIEPIVEAAKAEGVRPARHVLSSVIELARVKVFVPDAKWDADPDILVCRNGALHIPTRTLLPHSPSHYATSGLCFDYDVTATCPTWLYCLNSTIPDAADFLQEFAGYALTTSTRAEIALWFYGPKGSGKSTVIGGLQTMLGTRAGLLGLADIERSSFALTNLPGKTLIVATEQPATYIKTAHILNAIISGEPVTVDIKYRNPVVIVPHAKLAWSMNELPRVPDAGSGLFRRVKVIRFPELPASQRDPQIKEVVMTEGAGILNWALDGLARLNTRGRFDIPPCVQSATDDFEHNNDIPALFVAECCNIGPDYTTQATPLYNAYREWCKENGHQPQSSTTLAEDWRRLGFERYQAGGRNFWRGVRLVSKEVAP